jgi:NAD(P)H dehydrogenase (quinone)
MTEILIVYYSRHGSVAHMAKLVGRGVESVAGCTARIRTVADVSTVAEATADSIPVSGPPFASNEDIEQCQGLILGSPAYFGTMAAPLKYFLDQTTPLWLAGAMVDKPAAAFTSSSTFHGGQEVALLSMLTPLLHHGAVLAGLPYTLPELNTTTTGGAPYGATHVTGHDGKLPFSSDEESLCRALGKRVARLAQALRAG